MAVPVSAGGMLPVPPTGGGTGAPAGNAAAGIAAAGIAAASHSGSISVILHVAASVMGVHWALAAPIAGSSLAHPVQPVSSRKPAMAMKQVASGAIMQVRIFIASSTVRSPALAVSRPQSAA